MIKIEVKTEHVNEKSGITATTQKPYKIREQTVWAYLVSKDGSEKPYPTETRVLLEDGQFPYKPGFYTISPQSIFVGQFEKLSIGRLVLMPLEVSRAAVRSAA